MIDDRRWCTPKVPKLTGQAWFQLTWSWKGRLSRINLNRKKLDILCQIMRLVQVLVCWVFADLNVSFSLPFWFSSPFTSSLVPYQTFMSWYHRSAEGFGGEINKHKQWRKRALKTHRWSSVEDQWTKMQTLFFFVTSSPAQDLKCN